MISMLLNKLGRLDENAAPLVMSEVDRPTPGENEVLIQVSVCGVCHTELDEIEGRTPPARLPMILGHQVVGRVAAVGKAVTKRQIGQRVGVAWIFSACGKCSYCLSGQENLCSEFKATGRDANGGYAEYMTVGEDFCYEIPEIFTDAEAAPLLCAGAIGYRSLKLSGLRDGQPLGLTGFGASGHLVLMMVKRRYPQSKVYVFTRSEGERAFARELRADWAGDTADVPPERLHSIIDTTPAWKPVLSALKALEPGGRLVINAIRKEEADKEVLLGLDYPTQLWMEKEIKSAANITRQDVCEFLALAAEIPIHAEVEEYPLSAANRALFELKQRNIRGAKVLLVG